MIQQFLTLLLLLQTIPGVPAPSTTIYVPLVLTPAPALYLEAALIQHPDQRRAVLRHDARLAAGAQAKAEAIVASGLCAHNVYGLLPPNDAAREVGFPLAGGYAQGGNALESIGCWYASAGDALHGLIESEPHKIHLLGEHPFYLKQESIGVGFSRAGESGAGVYVIWIARAE